MENSNIQKLNDTLDKIETKISETKVMMIDKLNHEIEKLYTYNALGICKSKLSNNRGDEFKEGISRTKIYFEKTKKINY